MAVFDPMPRASDRTATPVTTGVLSSMRSASRMLVMTCPASSASRRPRACRQPSLAPSTLPKRSRARRRASAAGTPDRMRSRAWASRWNRTSSSSDSSKPSRRVQAVRYERRRVNIERWLLPGRHQARGGQGKTDTATHCRPPGVHREASTSFLVPQRRRCPQLSPVVRGWAQRNSPVTIRGGGVLLRPGARPPRGGITLTAITAITGVAASGVGVGGGVLAPRSRSGGAVPTGPGISGWGLDAPRTEANEGCVLGHAPAMLPPRFDTTRRQQSASSVAPPFPRVPAQAGCCRSTVRAE